MRPIDEQPAAQPEERTEKRTETHACEVLDYSEKRLDGWIRLTSFTSHFRMEDAADAILQDAL